MLELTETDVKENTGFAALWFLLGNRSVVETMEELKSRGVTKNRNQLSGILHSLKVQIKESNEVRESIFSLLSNDTDRLKTLNEWLTVGFRRVKSKIQKEPDSTSESKYDIEPYQENESHRHNEPDSCNEPNILTEPNETNEPRTIIEPKSENEPDQLKESHGINDSTTLIEPEDAKEPRALTEPENNNESIRTIESNGETQGTLLMDLTFKSCRFPLWGHTELPNMYSSRYCGREVANEMAMGLTRCYCTKHALDIQDLSRMSKLKGKKRK